jgi:hypothetical protein
MRHQGSLSPRTRSPSLAPNDYVRSCPSALTAAIIQAIPHKVPKAPISTAIQFGVGSTSARMRVPAPATVPNIAAIRFHMSLLNDRPRPASTVARSLAAVSARTPLRIAKRPLTRPKIYIVLRDPVAEKRGLVRTIDESGNDYFYPKTLLRAIALPQASAILPSDLA